MTLIDVALISIVSILVMLLTRTNADADLWGHLRFGADLLASGRLPAHDPYSFTSDIPWINHEWLSELIFAWLYTHIGAAGINLLKFAVISGIAALVWRCARRAGASTFAAVVLTSLVVMVTTTRTGPIRPQLFSVLCFGVLLAIGDRIEREAGPEDPPHVRGEVRVRRPGLQTRHPLTIALLFCFWANAHGGWIVGFGVLAVWAAWTRRFTLIAAAAAGTLVNPYGVNLWMFVRETVGLSRPEIVDWKPLLGLPPAIVAVELLVPAVAVAAVWRTRRMPPLRHIAILAVLGFGTLRVSRIDAFLHVAVAMICAPAIVELLNAFDARLRRSRGLSRPSFANAAAAATLALAAVAFTAVNIGRITVEGEWMPDGEALHFIEGHLGHTRLVTWFDWGEYAIWHLAPKGIQVSMDGRRETVYSDRVLREHFAFYADSSSDAWRYPDRVGASRVWLPKKLKIVEPLRAHGWHAIFESPTSVVLARDVDLDQIAQHVTRTVPGRAEFPGP